METQLVQPHFTGFSLSYMEPRTMFVCVCLCVLGGGGAGGFGGWVYGYGQTQLPMLALYKALT